MTHSEFRKQVKRLKKCEFTLESGQLVEAVVTPKGIDIKTTGMTNTDKPFELSNATIKNTVNQNISANSFNVYVSALYWHAKLGSLRKEFHPNQKEPKMRIKKSPASP